MGGNSPSWRPAEKEPFYINAEDERGDVILNPTNDCCTYWNISSEGYDLATYKTVMISLFPSPVVRDATATIFNQ